MNPSIPWIISLNLSNGTNIIWPLESTPNCSVSLLSADLFVFVYWKTCFSDANWQEKGKTRSVPRIMCSATSFDLHVESTHLRHDRTKSSPHLNYSHAVASSSSCLLLPISSLLRLSHSIWSLVAEPRLDLHRKNPSRRGRHERGRVSRKSDKVLSGKTRTANVKSVKGARSWPIRNSSLTSSIAHCNSSSSILNIGGTTWTGILTNLSFNTNPTCFGFDAVESLGSFAGFDRRVDSREWSGEEVGILVRRYFVSCEMQGLS